MLKGTPEGLRNRMHFATEIHGWHTDRCRKQQGRQNDFQDQVRFNLNSPHLRKEANPQANSKQDQR